jgi:capsular polysaccharide transport system permease protein
MNKLLNLPTRLLQAVVIGAPVLLVALYLAFVAAHRYVSESRVAVQLAGSENASAIPGAAMLLAGVKQPSHTEALFVQQYVHSLALLQVLDKELDLRGHYSGEKVDLLYRLPADASQEDFHAYYRERVEVLFDDVSMVLTIRVQAFNSEFAEKLNRRILELSERFVNETSRIIAREQLGFAEGELKVAAERVEKAQTQLLAFQNRNRLVDPAQQAQAAVALSAELQASLSRREAELKSLRAYLNDNAPQVLAARNDIRALKEQLEAERTRATGDGRQSQRLNALALDFQALKLQVDFANDAYKLALGAVENARIEASRKVRSLVTIEPPTRPQTAYYPMHAYTLLTVLVVCVLLYAILRLVLATIREHQD